MDTLLRGQDPAEVIPFSLDAPVLYYPVRHHSPACAWHLERVIQRYAPDCILVEGPENANHLIPVLTHPDTRAPVALYYAYRDEAGLLDTEHGEESFRCYYPFLDHSPELAALRSAAALGIPAQFMDLPYGEILLATRDARGLRAKEEKLSYASDRYLAASRFQKLLCEKTGLRGFEEFWEKYFETAGMFQTDEAFVRQMNAYCLLARQNTPEEELTEDGCLAREAHMALRVREAAEQFSKVLVVAGGFHIWGLLHGPAQTPERGTLPEKDQSVYPMRYTMPAADALSGYASGMPSPGFYASVWAALHAGAPDQVWDQVVLDYLVRTGRRLRGDGATISAFDETCALQQARGLAELRQKPGPGLYELQDAVLSAFVKGEASLSGVEPLRVLRTLTTGKAVGQLCEGALAPPLAHDFDAQCKKHRLKQEAASRQELTLSIFSEPRHRAASRFLHQSVFLDCGFAQRTKGPDLLRRRDRNLIRESWTYRWTAAVDAALIEHAVSGATVREACATELRQRMAAAGRAEEGAALLVQGFLMGIGDVSDALAGRMDELLIQDGDFASLCAACASLNTLEEWQAQYGEQSAYDYPALLGRCFDRVLNLLPSMGAVDDRQVPSVQQACMLLYQVTGRDSFAAQRPALLDAFQALTRRDPLHPALHGAALGLLYGADPDWKREIDAAIRGYLQGTPGMLAQSAPFLQGLFYTARDLLLVDPDFLSKIDRLLCALEDNEFTRLLPELRLAFSYFVPTETDRLAKRAAALHGGAGDLLRHGAVDPAAYTRAEALNAWAAARLDGFAAIEEGEEH